MATWERTHRKSIMLLKHGDIELTFHYRHTTGRSDLDLPTLHVGNKWFDSIKEAVKYFNQETTRNWDKILKQLENREKRPTTNVISRHSKV